MGNFLRVSPEELKVKSTDMYSISTRFQANYEQIFAKVDTLANSWKGEGFEAFKTRIYGFKNDLDSLKNLLDKYAEYLEVTHANYLNAEAKIIQSAQDSLKSGV